MASGQTIHDLLSIGEIEAALSSNQESDAEIDRLPLLLRLLAAGQPLSAVPHLMPNTLAPNQNSDPLANAVVSRLEDVAATHSAAESIDVLVTHIAPSISRRISKLQPLKRKSRDEWSTSELAAIALAPLSNMRNKKSRLHSMSSDSMVSNESDDTLDEASGDEMEDVSETQLHQEVMKRREWHQTPRHVRSEGRESLLAGMQEDSAEAHLTRVLSEVASLVVESLQPPPPAPKEEQEEAPPERILSVKADSLLSESDTTMVGGNDLGACLSAILHHAPVLRHAHVASAFCRASVPQSATLIYRMGANSPNAVACLVRGCIDAVAAGDATESTVATAKESVRRLAKLSPWVAARIRGMLESSMLDVQLELALEQDALEAACLLNQHLAKGVVLKDLLQTNSVLVSHCYECLLSRIELLETPSGELKVFLRALTWLLHSIRNAKTEALSSAATTLASTLSYMCRGSMETKPETSNKDDVFGLVLSGSLVLCSLLALSGGQGREDEVRRTDVWQNLLKQLLTCNPPSTMTEVLVSRIATLLHSQELILLQEMMQEFLSSQEVNLRNDGLQDGFIKLCKWAVMNGNLDTLCNRTLTHEVVVLDPSALLQMIVANYIEATKLESLMESILKNPDSASKLVRHKRLRELLTTTITYLSKDERHEVPLVSQMVLYTLIRKAFSKIGDDASELTVSHMALNFTYAVICYDENPNSPFSFDPRDQPVVEILRLIKSKGLESVFDLIRSTLCKHTPEIIYELDCVNTAITTLLYIPNESRLNHQDVKNLLAQALRKTLDNPSGDPSGLKVERAFLLAQRHIPSTQVDCLVVRTLLSSPNSPIPFLTYGMLSRDPLLLLQFPVAVWQCRGIRRVALSVLGRLLPANENLARQASPSEVVADELLTCRNVVLLRCFLSLACGCTLSDDGISFSRLIKPCQCHVLTGMIRALVASQTGLVAILIKNGLPDEVVDWLVDFVPECVNDAFALTILLSERSPLTAAERLKTADAAMRIAIAFGSRDEAETRNLAGACLHQLVNSFYLVLGPVGVPVNALIEESGMDLTQVCRKATFRILGALQKVRGSRIGLKTECSVALQKLANLCKGESGVTGFSGAVANRRKALLKEIWDAVIRALNGMGSGVSLT
jgi:hypothetical protein